MLARLLLAAASTFVAGFGATAWGQGVGGTSPIETAHVLQERTQPDGLPKQWDVHVGLPDSRIGVELDPAGSSWLKHFQRNGSPLSILPQHHIYLYEHLAVSGGLSWTSWTQEVEAPDFTWALSSPFPSTTFLANGAVPSGLSITTDGALMRFSFDPLPPGTQIDIFTGLVYHGSQLADVFDMNQFPVPEPATILFVGAAASALRRSKRRRS